MPHRIDIFDDIGSWGITSSLFASWLKEAGGAPVEVHINSYGGDVFEGIAIMNSLRDYEAEVTVIVEGIAASAASYIAVGGADSLIMQESASLMVHDAWADVSGNPAEVRKWAEKLERMSDVIAQIYADKSGTPAKEWREAMAEDAYFSAEEAVLVGLADEIRSGARVSNDTRTRMFNAMRFASRDQAPEPAIVRRVREKGKSMNFVAELAKQLGVEGREDDLKASLLAFMNKETPDSAPEEEPADEAVAEDTGEAVDDPAESDEHVTDDETAETKEQDDVDPEGEESDAEEESEEFPNDYVMVPKSVYEDMVAAQAKFGDMVAAQAKFGDMVAADRDRGLVAEVDRWIADGRFSAPKRNEALADIRENPELARRTWGRLPKNSVNRVERGYGVDNESNKARGVSPFSKVKY
ncbi:head maturation protease, ClpP-related [Corynebacterium diphtheriae]|uniref:head maturation protease, ClpP-related n=1 Tax=Corynebacterium diphtheriae TaxID=1717 RepID=UPI0018CA38E6|nr:Clp protease ClpP [Corynebacterium diphtheriae bv. mitis]